MRTSSRNVTGLERTVEEHALMHMSRSQRSAADRVSKRTYQRRVKLAGAEGERRLLLIAAVAGRRHLRLWLHLGDGLQDRDVFVELHKT